MTRRLPILATLLVLAAVGTMLYLGVWQLQRKAWKENCEGKECRAPRIVSEH